MASFWYYRKNGTQYGPVASRELKAMAASGKLIPTDMISREDLSGWRTAGSAKGLFTPVDSPAIANASAGQPSQTTSSQWFYMKGHKSFGPVSRQQLKELADKGGLQPEDMVGRIGMPGRRPALLVKGLFSSAPAHEVLSPQALQDDEEVADEEPIPEPLFENQIDAPTKLATDVQINSATNFIVGCGEVILGCILLVATLYFIILGFGGFNSSGSSIDPVELVDHPERYKGRELRFSVNYRGGGTRIGGSDKRLINMPGDISYKGGSLEMDFDIPDSADIVNLHTGDRVMVTFTFSRGDLNFGNIVKKIERP
jgi:GYF domain 2